MKHAIIMLVLSFIATGPLAQTPRQVRLILVVPAGESLTDQERTIYRVHAQAALDWWQQHAPHPITHTLGVTEVITPDADVYHDLRSWSLPYLTENNPGMTLFLIDNSTSNALLFDDSGGESQDYYGAIWAVMHGVPDSGAVIAHEVGHVSYHLNHPATCGNGTLDLMCYQGMVTAYRLGFIGCASLAALGAPCTDAYLPAVWR